MSRRFFIIAGEASGDLHASKLIHEIKKLSPLISFSGIGGDLMKKEGLSSMVRLSKMAVMGFWEVARNISFLKDIESKIINELRFGQYEALILVDYPGFNLRIAKKIKRLNSNIPIFFYISPQIWAWKEKRLEIIKKYVDKMIVFFPFEKEWYKTRGVEVDFVGHPFADDLSMLNKSDSRNILLLKKNKKYLTLYPGSREQEIKSHLPIMLSALKNDYFKDFELLLGCAPTISKETLNLFDLKNIKVVKGNSIHALACSDFAWVGSGTSSLESVFLRTPSIVVYKTSFLSWHIIKFLTNIRFAGMPNIILNREIMPELLQNDLTPENLVRTTKLFFSDKSFRDNLFKGYEEIIKTLGGAGASKRAAQSIMNGL